MKRAEDGRYYGKEGFELIEKVSGWKVSLRGIDLAEEFSGRLEKP